MSEHGTIPTEGGESAGVTTAPDAPMSASQASVPDGATGLAGLADHAADEHHVDAHDPDGHGHGSTLGPIDWRAYGAGAIGAALGLVVAAVLAVSTGYIVL
jgi:hypothetical protein